MKQEQRFIPVPMEFRHFSVKDYLRKGIEDPVELSSWVESMTDKIDRFNEEGESYKGQSHDLINELLQFGSTALRNVKYAMYKDKDYIERLNGRIRQLELEKQYTPKPKTPDKDTKSVSDAGKKEIEALAKAIR